MDKGQMLNSILSYLKTDIMTVELTQCNKNWHDYNYVPSYSKIYYILSGEGSISVGGTKYYPKRGQLCIMPANHMQSYEAETANPYLKYWTHFTCESGGKSIFDIIEVPFVIDVDSEITAERLKNIFSEMIKLYEKKTYTSNIKLESYLRELLAIYLDCAGLERIKIINSKDNKRQSEIIKYIDENIQNKLSVEEIANKVYLHPNYFSKYFKNVFGVSPAKYINSRKTEAACIMLRQDSLTITEIASKLNYSDIYHFSKVFKKYTGFSPSYYKSRIAQDVGTP